MAVTYQYNENSVTLDNIYLATSGGTSFGSNLAGNATMDYFDDASVVDDAIYFGDTYSFSDLLFDVSTQLATTSITVAWEYYDGSSWTALEQLTDNTNAFQNAGTNIVVFPYQYSWSSTTINGVSKKWVRVRITAVSGLTEGGANQTTAVYAKDGFITFSGTASDDMALLSGLYTWMNTNHPEVEMVQTGSTNNVYFLHRAEIHCASDQYFNLDCEYFELAHPSVQSARTGPVYQYNWNATDCTFKRDGNRGGNYWYLESSTFTRVNLISGGQTLRISGSGTGNVWTDVNTIPESAGDLFRSFEGTGTFTRVTIMRFLSLGGMTMTITDSEFLSYVSLYYANAFAVENSRFSYSGHPLLLEIVEDNRTPQTYLCTNNEEPFDDVTLSTGPIYRYITNVTINKAYFYDASADTYTDYTTAINDDTADDVPINGDVGDCLYVGATHSFFQWSHSRGQGAKFVLGEANSDYEYAYEWYDGANWVSLPLSQSILTDWGSWEGYDDTNDLGQDGKMYFRRQSGTGQVAVNGYTAYWLRIRITTKGTGSPTLTRAYLKTETGIHFWHLHERYTFDLKVVDNTNTAISGATVVITDSDDTEQFSGTTDANGDITQQTLIYKDFWFDPFNENGYPQSDYDIVQKTYGDYTVTITKSGYITKTIKYTMDQKRTEIEALENVVKWIKPENVDDIIWNLDNTNQSNKYLWTKV